MLPFTISVETPAAILIVAPLNAMSFFSLSLHERFSLFFTFSSLSMIYPGCLLSVYLTLYIFLNQCLDGFYLICNTLPVALPVLILFVLCLHFTYVRAPLCCNFQLNHICSSQFQSLHCFISKISISVFFIDCNSQVKFPNL